MATTEKRKKVVTGVTPKGVAVWPHLNKPDFGTEKFPIPDGAWKVTLRLPVDVAQKLIDKLTPIYEAWVNECEKNFKPTKARKKFSANEPPWGVAYIRNEEGEDVADEDYVDFKFKSSYRVKNKDGSIRLIKLDFFNAKGKPISGKVPDIWGGSSISVAYSVNEYDAPIGTGISLRLNAVQIIELRQSIRDASSYGFSEEDGYDEEGEEDAPFEDESGEEDTDEQEDF